VSFCLLSIEPVVWCGILVWQIPCPFLTFHLSRVREGVPSPRCRSQLTKSTGPALLDVYSVRLVLNSLFKLTWSGLLGQLFVGWFSSMVTLNGRTRQGKATCISVECEQTSPPDCRDIFFISTINPFTPSLFGISRKFVENP
jgi:hypothetical protein